MAVILVVVLQWKHLQGTSQQVTQYMVSYDKWFCLGVKLCPTWPRSCINLTTWLYYQFATYYSCSILHDTVYQLEAMWSSENRLKCNTETHSSILTSWNECASYRLSHTDMLETYEGFFPFLLKCMGILASQINNHEKIFGILGQTKTRWCFLGKKHSVHCLAKMPL